jgi:Na+/H+-dicarboxylate symporter
MLQVIFFAVIFGIAMILLPEDKSKPVKDFFDSFNEIILKMIDIIMLFSPIGVFALLAAIVAESPSLDLFKALGMYGLTVIIGLILVMSFYLFLVKVFAKKSPKFFINGISPAQLLAFSTSSSAATLPVTMERTVDNLGVDDEVASFVLPKDSEKIAALKLMQCFNHAGMFLLPSLFWLILIRGKYFYRDLNNLTTNGYKIIWITLISILISYTTLPMISFMYSWNQEFIEEIISGRFQDWLLGLESNSDRLLVAFST